MAQLRRTWVLHPDMPRQGEVMRDPDAQLEEGMRLAQAIPLELIGGSIVSLPSPRPSTLFGQGKIEEIGAHIEEEEIGLIIVNSKLSPVQQRNLEKAWQCKVIDRTALILEIFGERARTREGKLQVELAALNYQKSRLVRSWTHLERQRGGFGFLGGPGESQIETDRRLIRDRITKIKRELTTVTRTRELHRKTRREVPYPLVALVGYTNAGKSTLFNRLTHAKVEAADKLFATLDPTLRGVRLPSGLNIILSDTVGFVSDLPTDLIAAFRATLEEVIAADIILHVRDISHPDTLAQAADVEEILADLLGETEVPVIEVHNKADLLAIQPPKSKRKDAPLLVSALTGDGIDKMLERLGVVLAKEFYRETWFNIPAENGQAQAWAWQHGTVINQEHHEDIVRLHVRMSPENIQRLQKMLRD